MNYNMNGVLDVTGLTEKESSILVGALRLWSALSHGLGAILALVGTTILLCRSWFQEDITGLWVFGLYGLSMICLYTASTLYHSVGGSMAVRRALRKFDHCSIYFLIAGSYTPICLIALGNDVGYMLFGVIWTCALLGMTLTAVRLNIPHWVSSLIYLAMGWMAVLAIGPLYQALSTVAMNLLLTSGFFYTLGGIFYAMKWPWRDGRYFGCHEVFHVLILLGSVFHFLMMFYI